MYSLLTRMPLLMGISGQDLARMEERLNLQVETIPASNYPILNQGRPCTQLFFLLDGELRKERLSADRLFSTVEYLPGPAVVEPENLYGLHCLFEHTYYATRQCRVVRLSKHDVGTHLMKSEIFRINYMNTLSAQIYRLKGQAVFSRYSTAREKLVAFLQKSFSTAEPRKIMKIKMTDLADYLDETRLTISQVLNRMESDGLLQLRRKEILIPDIDRIINSKDE